MNYSGKMHLKFPTNKGFICDRAPARADCTGERLEIHSVMN